MCSILNFETTVQYFFFFFSAAAALYSNLCCINPINPFIVHGEGGDDLPCAHCLGTPTGGHF